MRKPLTIQLLEQFDGVGKQRDITAFMVKHFRVKTKIFDEAREPYTASPTLFLTEMVDSLEAIEQIKYYDLVVAFYDDNDGYTKPIWENENTMNRLYFSMTIKGEKYLEKYKKNHRGFFYIVWDFISKFWTIIAGIVALITFILAFFLKQKSHATSPKKLVSSSKIMQKGHQKLKTTKEAPKTLPSDSLGK